ASLAAKGKAKAPRVNISWVAAQSARGIASYRLDLRKDGHWSTVSKHLAPSTMKLLKLRYGPKYLVRMQAPDVRGRRSHMVGTDPFSISLTDQDSPQVSYSSGF